MSLTKEQRAALPETDFAVPGKRKLPIHDVTHCRLAHDMLDRAQGLTDDERAHARRAILDRAKTLGIDTTEWATAASVSFEAMALEMPEWDGHPNRMPFSGVLTRIDQPSDKPPGGDNGQRTKRTIMSREVAEAALPSLLGMAVDFKPDFTGHDPQNKIGVITEANVVGDAVEIKGHFYAKDFPGECARIRAEKGALGFSFEVDARIQDADADPWVIQSCVFTGAAVLYKNLAAYTSTSLAAQASKDIDMTPEEFKAQMAEAIKPLVDQIQAQAAELVKLKAGASLGGAIIDQVKPHVDALNACANAMEAAGVGNDSSSGHARYVRAVAAHMAAEAVNGRVPKVFTDHSFLPEARIEASVAKQIADVTTALKAAQDQSAALETQVKDLKAAAFQQSQAPARSTISPEVKRLLAKGSVDEGALSDGKKLSVTQFDTVLTAAGVTDPTARMTAKLQAMNDGILDSTTK